MTSGPGSQEAISNYRLRTGTQYNKMESWTANIQVVLVPARVWLSRAVAVDQRWGVTVERILALEPRRVPYKVVAVGNRVMHVATLRPVPVAPGGHA